MTNIVFFSGSRKSLRRFDKKTHIILIFLLFTSSIFGQITLKGVVLDKTNYPLPGVSVFVKSTKTGTVTDLDGNFSLNTDHKLPLTLSISFIGFRTQEIDVYEVDEPIKVVLSENLNILNEVVVTGVAEGTSRKKLAFALTKIDDELIKTVPATDASLSFLTSTLGHPNHLS